MMAMHDLKRKQDGVGVLTMAFGEERYVRQAENLALSLAHNMPSLPVSVITDRTSVSDLFDRTVTLDATLGLGTVQKVYLDHYTPYRRTLFIDADSLVARPFDEHLSALVAHSFTPVSPLYRTRTDRDEFFDDLGGAIEATDAAFFAKFNGGFYYFDDSAAARQVFERARALRDQADDLGIRPFDRAGPGDESLFGLALGCLADTDLYDDGGGLMATPIGLTGRLAIDPFGGGSRFLKHGRMVEPAICHFAGIYANTIEYRRSTYLLRMNRSNSRLSGTEQGRLLIQHYGDKVRRRWARTLARHRIPV